MNHLLTQAAATPQIDSNTRLIPLTQGKFALVDAADYEWLMRWKWCASYCKSRDIWYAVRSVSTATGKTTVAMHRIIMDATPGMEVDHKDGDGLNNRRSTNLRTATRQQNSWNRGPSTTNTSGFKGVSWHKRAKKWRATMQVNGKYKELGMFDSKEQAARVRDEAEKKYRGEFAAPNCLP